MAEVRISKSDFLFLGADGNNYLKYLQGDISYPFAEAFAIIECHRRYRNFLASRGIDYRWIIVPAKERILVEELDLPVKLNALPVNVIKSCLKSSDPGVAEAFLDLGDVRDLYCGYAPESLYHKNDTHWTHHLAFRSYRYIMDSFFGGRYGKSWDIPIVSKALQEGDLGRIIGRPAEEIFYHHPLVRPRRVFCNETVNNGRVELFEGGGAAAAIFIHSSSFDYMKEFFCSSFNRSLCIFSPHHMDGLAEEKPDIVVNFVQERYLPRAPTQIAKVSDVKYFLENDRPKSMAAFNEFFVDSSSFLGRVASSTAEIYV